MTAGVSGRARLGDQGDVPMEMQIPRLRKLFEARVGQILSVLSKDPPPEIGNVELSLRGLKGFLLALEGMLRKNELQGLPFSARQELFARVDRVLDAMQSLPDKLDHQQALAVLRGMDNLHRLCLQENLMASGMDASKLGKLTVILEHKLGGVLESIDGVAETARGHVEKIEQAARERLAEIQGAYKKESEVLEGSASLAVESIRSQAESIQHRQAEVMAQIDELQQELIEKRRQWQGRLDEQLAAAQEVVDEAQGRQKSIQELLNRTQTQLSAAEAAIREMGAITQAAEDARKDLQAKLGDGDEVISSIRGLLEAGTLAGGELSVKAAEARQCLAGVQQASRELDEFSVEARQRQQQAIDAARATAEKAERMAAEARQRLDEQLKSSAESLAGVESNSEASSSVLAQIRQQHQAVAEAGQAVAEARQAAEDARKDLQAKLGDGDEVISSIRGLLEAGTLAGGELSAKAAEARQCLAGVEKTKHQCEQFADEARRKLDAHFEAAEKVLADIHVRGEAVADATAETRQRRQEAAEAAQAAAESRRQAEGELTRLEASSARGAQSADQLEAIERTGGDMKARMAQAVAEAGQARERIGQAETEVSEAAAEVRQRKQEAVEALREAIADAQGRQRQFEQAVSEWRQAAHAAVVDLRGDQAIGAEMLGRTRQDIEALQAEIGKIHELRSSAEQAGGEVRATLEQAGGVLRDLGGVTAQAGQAKAQVDAHLAGSAEARRRLEQLERDTATAAEDMGCWQAEALSALRSEAAAAGEQRKASEAALMEQLELARSVVGDVRARKESADGLAEQARQQRDAAMACAQSAGEARQAVAEAGGEVQGRLAEARRAVADLAGLLKGGAETHAAIDRELDAARRAGGEVGEVRREAGELLDHVRGQRQEVDDARQQSQQIIATVQSDAGQVLDRLAGQTSDLVARNERLRQELEEMMGQAADGGLFRQFDELAGQSAPRLRKWLWLLIGSGAGGAAVTAGGSALLTSVSIWAGGAVLVAGLVPLAVFLGFCAVQYNAERRVQSRHHYRAALSRSLAAYRKLLVTMRAEGIAESAYADRMLSELFGAAAANGEDHDLKSMKA
jgi:chromosome segregation ATPase